MLIIQSLWSWKISWSIYDWAQTIAQFSKHLCSLFIYVFFIVWLHRGMDQQKNMNARGEMVLLGTDCIIVINIINVCELFSLSLCMVVCVFN